MRNYGSGIYGSDIYGFSDPTDVKVQGVAVIPEATEDEIWLIVRRILEGRPVYYLEQMQPRNYGDLKDAWFVDSGLKYEGTPTATLTGLGHLQGQVVTVLGDGVELATATVSGGEITLANTVTKAIVGLSYRYTLKPMRFDLLTRQGTTKGSLKRFAELGISFFESSGAKYGVDIDQLFEIDWPATGLYTGDKVVAHEGGFDAEDSIIITGDGPLPCIVRAMIPRIEKTGR